jgi:hypothetical protein
MLCDKLDSIKGVGDISESIDNIFNNLVSEVHKEDSYYYINVTDISPRFPNWYRAEFEDSAKKPVEKYCQNWQCLSTFEKSLGDSKYDLQQALSFKQTCEAKKSTRRHIVFRKVPEQRNGKRMRLNNNGELVNC